MNLLIAIPAFNEEKSIENVVNSVMIKVPEYDYVVINDGSDDETLDICLKNGYHVLNLPINLGLGSAFGCAMRYAFNCGYDAVVQIDGDAQHDPVYIKDLVNKMESDKCDLVIGSRCLDSKMPVSTLRGIGSRIIALLIFFKTGKRISDPTSGMRLYGKEVIDEFVKNSFLEPEPNTLAYLLKRGYKIAEVQVEMQNREAGRSYLRGFKTFRYMFNVCMSILLV